MLCAVAWVGTVILTLGGSSGEPQLVYSGFHPAIGKATVLLTNASCRSWEFALNIVQGQLSPQYWIEPQKGEKLTPGWCDESEEGIACSGWIYADELRQHGSAVLGPRWDAAASIQFSPKAGLYFSPSRLESLSCRWIYRRNSSGRYS